MIDQIDSILFHLRNSDSKKPMLAEALAEKLEVSIERFEEMMNVICNIVPAPVNRAYREVTENLELKRAAFKGYVYWPTGVIDRAHWKDFKPASSKQPAQPIRTEISTPKVSADTYETPIFGATPEFDSVFDQIAKIIDTATADAPIGPVLASDPPDYSDKPKAYQMLKYIEAHPGSTNRDIMLAVDMDPYTYCTAFIKPYIDFIQIDKTSEGHKTFTVTKPVDEFYRHHKPYEKKSAGAKHETVSIPQQPEKTTATDTVDAQGPTAEPQGAALPQVQTATGEVHKTQMEHDHPAAKVRFAITSDNRIILMGLTADDIELTEADSFGLIKFCGDIALATTVSDALANRMDVLEMLGS